MLPHQLRTTNSLRESFGKSDGAADDDAVPNSVKVLLSKVYFSLIELFGENTLKRAPLLFPSFSFFVVHIANRRMGATAAIWQVVT